MQRAERRAAVLLIESAAAVIAFLLPVVPNETGSNWSPATLIWPAPSYVQDVVMWFALTNVLLLVAGVAAWMAMKSRG